MKSAVAISLAIAACFAGSMAWADEYTMMGAGVRSCGEWFSDRQGKKAGASPKESWVLGYISAINSLYPAAQIPLDLLKGMDAEGIFVWIDNYCRDHPLDLIGNAAASAVGALKAKREALQR
jgi:hypothetical protein